MASLAEIEVATKTYADKRGLLILKVELLNTEIEELKRKHLGEIKALAGDTANAKGHLEAIIDSSRSLFVKPRSIVIAGIKVGLKKGSGKIEFDDEELVIKRIKKLYPKEDEREIYIKTTEKLRKKPLEDLDAVTLKKLGCTLEDTGDVVLIKATDSDVDKLIGAILKESVGTDDDLQEAA